MVYAEFGGQTECIMGNWKIENISQREFTRVKKYIQRNQTPSFFETGI